MPSTLNPWGGEGQKKNLKCSVLYLDSKAASAMNVEPSVAHCATGRMEQASDMECHRSHNRITLFLGLTHSGTCSTVPMANATLTPIKVYLWRMLPLNTHKRSGSFFFFLNSICPNISFSNPELYLKLTSITNSLETLPVTNLWASQFLRLKNKKSWTQWSLWLPCTITLQNSVILSQLKVSEYKFLCIYGTLRHLMPRAKKSAADKKVSLYWARTQLVSWGPKLD